jgi:DEAD/DEAH box helicase domain-containing protein
MLPSILSRQVRVGVEDQLRASFAPSTKGFDQIIDSFIKEPDSLIKGPWLTLEMPFRRSQREDEFFPAIPLGFRAYKHQEKAFQRLSGDSPRSTLIATGTGSGKTECFLLPILDACVRAKRRPGIKAIIIYPMNALATDQARRLAALVAKTPALAGMRVGMYADERPSSPSDEMTATSVIDRRDALVADPPDILLTNYKMLDYMLVRPDERDIWEKNRPETLRYLVVDELHTFDGAQGTDLACLIRRLKSRLDMPQKTLCCVGTSATLGGDSGAKDLLEYAKSIFDEDFDADAIVVEDRQSVDEYLAGIDTQTFEIPAAHLARELAETAPESGRVAFLKRAYAAWFGEETPADIDDPEWRIELAERLNGHAFLQGLLRITKGRPTESGQLCGDVCKSPHFKSWNAADVHALVDTFVALVAHARRTDAPGSKSLRPFLNVRHQLWVREMRRMVATICETPKLQHYDDLIEADQQKSLPVVHCRSCGGAGWATVAPNDASAPIAAEPKDVYDAYFGYSDRLRFIFLEQPVARGHKSLKLQSVPAVLCGECTRFQVGDVEEIDACPACRAPAENRLRVFLYQPGHMAGGDLKIDHDCAFCGSPSGMGIMGAQSVTLVSGMVGTVFGSEFNDDPKLLTFSDSVQDAAHRAAVFQARNATTVFRAGLSRFVCEAVKPDLASVIADAPSSMRVGQGTPEDFVATYLPADMEYRRDYQSLIKADALPGGSRLAEYLAERLEWETFAELTFKGRMGPTLERSGVAIAHVDGESIFKLASDLTARLPDELGFGWDAMEVFLVRKFLLGLLDHMRARGAVATDVTRLFVLREANWYPVWKSFHGGANSLPNISPAAPKPVFPTNKSMDGFENYVSDSSQSWYRSWFQTCFDPVAPMGDKSTEFFSLLFRSMEASGIVERMTIGGKDPNAVMAWGLTPDRIRVFSETALVRCGRCGNSHRVPAKYSSLWAGVSCTRIGCSGVMKDANDSDRTRFRSRLMTTGRIRRVLAAEHTSLQDRDTRQWVEERFMQDAPKSWYPNLLAATPTLEMGINIGDLSTLVLCSVPPEQANYVQRIGRTGRRDGNSLNVTVAMAKPHDMWFWTEPEEMIAGRVRTPGIHLRAVAILRRQFAAYTLDRWVAEKGASVSSYGKVGDALRAIKTANKAMFPLCWFDFVSENAERLFKEFVVLFPELDDRLSLEQLHAFAVGSTDDGLAHLVATEYKDVEVEVEAIQQRIDAGTSAANKLKKKVPPDLDMEDRLKDLTREKMALRTIRDDVKKTDNLGFLTERGVLPNYAFPAEGVTLKSVLYKTETTGDEEEEQREKPTVTEYVRSSATALSEFAPGAKFYTQGRKLKIDQIDLSASPIENWRVCPECIHIEMAGVGNTDSACPSCGSAMWADNGSKRPMIRLKQVLATGSDRATRIADDGDERDRNYFDRDYLPAVAPDQIGDAYAIDDESFPFGFEFLRHCTFREVNFGESKEAATGQKIGGKRRRGLGFQICRSCGKVQDWRMLARLPASEREKGLHLPRCREAKEATEKTFISVVYIYREFSSEAIRMLIPLATSYDDAAVKSLRAAIDLGLCLHFKGKVGHIRSTMVETKEGPLTRRNLFLFDTVPGGTGYLKQLSAKPDEMRDVFALARDHMLACKCNEDPTKDGCPRCIRSHSTLFGKGDVSRNTAVQRINQILAEWDKLKRVATVNDVRLNKALESELEQMFIERLRAEVKARDGRFNKIVIEGKPGYYVEMDGMRWNVELQCSLKSKFAELPMTRADFVFWPAIPTTETKPLAVYLDGWKYHEHTVAEDLALRQKLIRSGRVLVWSASWADIENAPGANTPNHYWDPLRSSTHWHAKIEKMQQGEDAAQEALSYAATQSFNQLLSFLRQPSLEVWERRAKTFAVAAFVQGMADGRDASAVASAVEHFGGEEAKETLEDLGQPMLSLIKSDSVGAVATAVVKTWRPPAWPSADDLSVAVGFEHRLAVSPEAKKAWNGGLRLLNLVQFLPYFFVGCVDGIGLEPLLRPVEPSPTDDWNEIEPLMSAEFLHLVKAMRERRIPLPEAFFDAVGEDGCVLGNLELAWPELRFGYVRDPRLAGAFPGWKIIVHSGGAEVPPELMEMAS